MWCGVSASASDAVIGYSLGESAGLFALRAWTDRDAMLARDERIAAVRQRPGRAVRRRAQGVATAAPRRRGLGDGYRGSCSRRQCAAPAAGLRRVYLLIINTPRECVLGGERAAVNARATTGLQLPAAAGDSDRALPGRPRSGGGVPRVAPPADDRPPGIRFYSTALVRSFELNPDSAAEAILAQALDTVDFPAVIESAYRDGVRIFLEMGPGASCTRMIGAILGDRPHRARSACVAGTDGVSSVLRLLAQLCAERVPVDLSPLYGPETVTSRRSSAGREAIVERGGWRAAVHRVGDETAAATEHGNHGAGSSPADSNGASAS